MGRARRAVVDWPAAGHTVKAGMLAMGDLQHAVAVSTNGRVVLNDFAELALNRRKGLRVVDDYVSDVTIGLSPRFTAYSTSLVRTRISLSPRAFFNGVTKRPAQISRHLHPV